jgi:uncharacterized protein YbjT (DUF2867 family)
MSARTATLIGATGLIGSELLQQLLRDPFYDTVKILIRRPVNVEHPKLEKKWVDFNDHDSMLVAIENSGVVFSAVGTTQRQVKGDNDAYRKVDFDIPVNAARFCKMTGCKIFALVSAVGANSKSKNFYLRLKGEVEEAVRATGIESIHVMRPSMLLGKREEFRLSEKIAAPLMKAFSFFLPKIYRAIEAATVAKAMLEAAKRQLPGFHVYEYQEMMAIAKNSQPG